MGSFEQVWESISPTLGAFTMRVTTQLDPKTNLPIGNSYKKFESGPAIRLIPVIFVQPNGENINVGDTLKLTIVVSGRSPLNYQWKKDGVNIGNNDPVYMKFDAQEEDSGVYTCVVTNSFGSISSAAAAVVVAVGYAPTIDTDPQGQNLNVGDTLTLTVVASGTAPLHYQWKKGLGNVGTDSDTYSKVNVQVGDADDYTCVVTNDFGSADSDIATVTVTAGSSLLPIFVYYYENL